MAIQSDLLTGYQLAELRKASSRRIILMIVQLLATLPAAASVVVQGEVPTYNLAALSVIMLVVWWVLNAIYVRARDASQTARRANLLVNGLGANFLPTTWQEIDRSFTVLRDNAKTESSTTYYDSKKDQSYARLAEIIEESAFYTSSIQAASATVMRVVVLIFVVIGVSSALLAIPTSSSPNLMGGVRLYLACAVFFLSSDVLGAMRGHASASQASERVRRILAQAAVAKYPRDEVLLAFADYVSAMAVAPEPLPTLFGFQKENLEERWNRYTADREEIS